MIITNFDLACFVVEVVIRFSRSSNSYVFSIREEYLKPYNTKPEILQGDTLLPFMFITCQDYVFQTSNILSKKWFYTK